MTRREARILLALAETVFPSVGTRMPSSEEAEVVEYVDDLLFHLAFKERLLIRSLLALLEVQTVVFNGTRPKLFSQASLEERTRNLRGWERSHLFQRRLVFMAIRTLLLWAYVDSQEAERDMGFVAGTVAIKKRNEARAASLTQMLDQATLRREEPSSDEAYQGAAMNVPKRPWGSSPSVDASDATEKHA